MAIIPMSQEGYNKLREEIKYLESVERPKASAAIAEARDKGDLSENSEYDAAKEAQGLLEMKISQLKDTLANARIIDESQLSLDTVKIMTRVKVRNVAAKKEMIYTLVSEAEANFKEGKLAVTTPIGKALIGHKVGETVDVVVPAGTIELEILEISL